MNGKPHTHQVRITREFGSTGCVLVEYGDTKVKTLHGPFELFTNHPSDRRIEKAIRRAIRKHDEGSRKAEDDQARLQRLASVVQGVPAGTWASDHLGGVTDDAD